ncbi:hypothetical protein C366_03823 [Cryptococcus neoformans Tu401-1]|nr:hypothetical protein C366_03823 [Cryptococcus neoformans var. grubii Tu401-1]OXM78374.1 hypothetical protein C364_03802 [Cryptococcus neoformans var. grubii Bt63]
MSPFIFNLILHRLGLVLLHNLSEKGLNLGFSSICLPSPTIISSLSYLRLRGLGMSKIKLDHKGDGAGFWNRKEKEGVSFEKRRSNEHVAGPYVGPWAIHFAKRTAPVAHRFNTTYAPSSDSILIPRPNPSHQATRFSVTVLEMFCWI